MNNFNQIVPVSELARNSQAILARATSLNKEPIILFKRNRPIAALVDFDKFSGLLKAQEEKEMKEALRAIAIAEKELKEGKVKTMKKISDLWGDDEN